jgi:hypothetical protein
MVVSGEIIGTPIGQTKTNAPETAALGAGGKQ